MNGKANILNNWYKVSIIIFYNSQETWGHSTMHAHKQSIMLSLEAEAAERKSQYQCIVFRKKWVSQLISSFDISVSETRADTGCLAPDLAG